MGLSALRDVSLKQVRECTTQWRFVLREEGAPLRARVFFSSIIPDMQIIP